MISAEALMQISEKNTTNAIFSVYFFCRYVSVRAYMFDLSRVLRPSGRRGPFRGGKERVARLRQVKVFGVQYFFTRGTFSAAVRVLPAGPWPRRCVGAGICGRGACYKH